MDSGVGGEQSVKGCRYDCDVSVNLLHLWGKMNTSRIVAGAALLPLMLTACSSPQPQSEPTVSVAPASTPSPTPTPTATPTTRTNERGEIIKKIGETAGLGNVDGGNVMTMKFKVASIKAITCDAPYATPPKGQAIAVALEIQTKPDFEGPLAINGAPGMISFSPYYWRGYAANGTRMNTVDSNISQNCLSDRTVLLPDSIGKGEKLNGLVILDVSTRNGSVAFEPQEGVAWTWNYSV